MPQVVAMIAPHVKEKVFPVLGELGVALIEDTEKAFEIRGEKDVVFSAINLEFVIGEADVQIEVRYTAGDDEYQQGKPFEPSKYNKKRLVELMSRTLRRILNGIVKSASIWPMPIRESEFSEVFIYPKGYIEIENAPEEVELSVMWGNLFVEPEFGKAIRMGKTWYIRSDPNPYANNRICEIPIAWHPE